MPQKTTIRLLVLPAVCAGIPLAIIPAAQKRAVSPEGDISALWFAMLLMFPFLLCLAGFFMALVGLAFRRTRRIAALTALCAVAFCTSVVVSLRIGDTIRRSAFVQLAERSRPLVAAIRAYEQKHGRPPESLLQLVPSFLSAVPSTGMGAYPEYRYSTESNLFAGNPWVLTVFTPSGGINFDQFMYFPLTNYPQKGFGGALERIGDWAYVHE